MNALTRLLLWLAYHLASDDRKERFPEWEDECQQVPDPVRHAFNFVTASLQSRPPFDVSTALLPAPLSEDVKTLQRLRRSVLLMSVLLGFYGLLILAVGTPPELLNWFLRAVTLTGGLLLNAYTGFHCDLPWLRGTRARSGVILACVFLPPLLLTLCQGWSLLGWPWFYAVLHLMVWDNFWAVRLPLRRRRFLRG